MDSESQTTGTVLRKCPVCRARLRGDEEPATPCRRCGSDLTAVRLAGSDAQRFQAEARRLLAQGRGPQAVRLAELAVRWVDCPETRRTLGAALAAAGRTEEARALLEARAAPFLRQRARSGSDDTEGA